MGGLSSITTKRRRHQRTRAKIRGTNERPRLSIAITNRHVIAQLIDDELGCTLAASTSQRLRLAGSLTQKAEAVGADIAKQAVKRKIKRVVLDRGPRRYHGRIKAMAEAARSGGLEF